MSYDLEKVKIGRKPALICEIDLDQCGNIYGETAEATLDTENLLTDHSDLNGADWTLSNATFVTLTGVLTDASASAGFAQQLGVVINSANYYTASIYIEKDAIGRATRFARLYIGIGDSSFENNFISFDTSTGDIGGASFQSTEGVYGVDDVDSTWWRLWMSCKSADTANTEGQVIIFPARGASASWVASDSATGSITVKGARLNTGETPVQDCTATGAAGDECYLTRATCQVLPAYFVSATPKTYQFVDVPVIGENLLPCITSSDLAPTVINPSKGLGQRASIKVNFQDFPHHDRGYDPYVSTRNYTPEDQGTFFGKLISRNKHYVGRPLRIKSGYIDDAGFDIADFQTRNYVIDSMTGPNASGVFTIVAKDILKLADDKRALCPAPSTGLLVAGITAGATSLTVTSGTESEYASDTYLRIGEEIILSPTGNRAANVFSNLSRGQYNTAAEAHDLGDSVQTCYRANDNVVDLVETLLTTFAGISSSYIPASDWASEETRWLSTATVDTLITAPEGVTSILQKLCEQYYFQIWWDEIVQEIKLKAIVPPSAVTPPVTVNEDSNLLKDKTSALRDDDKRLSRVVVYYNPRNPVEVTKPEHFKSLYIIVDSDAESAIEYGDQRVKIIYAEFITSLADAARTGSRLLNRFVDSPNSIKLSLDAKDSSFRTGDLIKVDSARTQNADGSNRTMTMQVMSVQENTKGLSGSVYDYNLLQVGFGGRYANIGPDTLNDYSSESDANLLAYAFVGPATGGFDDGESVYLII